MTRDEMKESMDRLRSESSDPEAFDAGRAAEYERWLGALDVRPSVFPFGSVMELDPLFAICQELGEDELRQLRQLRYKYKKLRGDMATLRRACHATLEWSKGHWGVLREVYLERRRQDDRWGEQNHDPVLYLAIIGEEYGEACQAALHDRYGGEAAGGLRAELIQLAACAVAAVECLDRAKWRWGGHGDDAEIEQLRGACQAALDWCTEDDGQDGSIAYLADVIVPQLEQALGGDPS